MMKGIICENNNGICDGVIYNVIRLGKRIKTLPFNLHPVLFITTTLFFESLSHTWKIKRKKLKILLLVEYPKNNQWERFLKNLQLIYRWIKASIYLSYLYLYLCICPFLIWVYNVYRSYLIQFQDFRTISLVVFVHYHPSPYYFSSLPSRQFFQSITMAKRVIFFL